MVCALSPLKDQGPKYHKKVAETIYGIGQSLHYICATVHVHCDNMVVQIWYQEREIRNAIF
jgi:hypothetical protein